VPPPPACGSGTGGISSTISGGGNGSSLSPTQVGNFKISSPEISPATIELNLIDANSDQVLARFFYRLAGGVDHPIGSLVDLVLSTALEG
jgi:hypothetical protein